MSKRLKGGPVRTERLGGADSDLVKFECYPSWQKEYKIGVKELPEIQN